MEERRLAAVVISDISGYTALMGDNEQKALRLLRWNRRLHYRLCNKYHGQIKEYAGDGTYACFKSAIDAVLFAIGIIKKSTAEKNYSLHIGIHLAEIIFTGNKIYGEGVSLANRIQLKAAPGEILISGVVYRNIQNYEDLEVEQASEKLPEDNFADIDIYRLNPELLKYNAREIDDGFQPGIVNELLKPLFKKKIFWFIRGAMILLVLFFIYLIGISPFYSGQHNIPERSIAVLPFKNVGGDQETAYFANGVTESILNDLSRISSLKVTSRTSTERYRESGLLARSIGRQLDVNYLLEGSVQKYENKVRIVVQLINAGEDKHIWSETYDRDFKDLLNLESEIAGSVAEHLNTLVTPAERQMIEKPATTNMEAYDLYIRGRELTNIYVNTNNENYLNQALQLFRLSADEDPGFAQPYFGMGALYFYRYGPNSEKYLETDFADTVMSLCNHAISLDPNLAEAYCLRGYFKYFMCEYNEAINDQFNAIHLNPNLSLAYLNLGVIYDGAFNDKINALRYLKRAESREKSGTYLNSILVNTGEIYLSLLDTAKAEFYFKKALKAMPGNYLACNGLANIALYFRKDYNTALAYADSVCTNYPDSYYCSSMKGKIYAIMGDFKKSNEEFEKVRDINKQNHWILLSSSALHGYVLSKIGQTSEAGKFFNDQVNYCQIKERSYNASGYDLAGTYAYLGKNDQSLATFGKFIESGFFGISGTDYRILNDPLFNNIRNTEKFKALLNVGMEEIRLKRNEINSREANGSL